MAGNGVRKGKPLRQSEIWRLFLLTDDVGGVNGGGQAPHSGGLASAVPACLIFPAASANGVSVRGKVLTEFTKTNRFP